MRTQLLVTPRKRCGTSSTAPELLALIALWVRSPQITHSGADMDTAFQMAQGSLDGDAQWNISDLLNNRNEWWVLTAGSCIVSRALHAPLTHSVSFCKVYQDLSGHSHNAK